MKLSRFQRLLRHRWLDTSDARRAISPELIERLQQRVAASERRHTGEVRIYVEASLPPSYLWRHWHGGRPIEQIVRERAVMMFAKLRMWDTAQRNGVLIYLLLAEHAIELVADRGLATQVPPADWQGMVDRLGQRLADRAFEDGLTQALEEVSATLVQHFPAPLGLDGLPLAPRRNELPDTLVLG